METNLIKNIFKQKQEQQRIFVIFEMLCLIPALLLTIIFFGDVPKKEIVVCIVMAFIVMYEILRWRRKKAVCSIIQLLERELSFWESQKLEYQKVMEEITKKAGKEVNLTWFSNKIVLTEKNIQEIESWIEKFQDLSWNKKNRKGFLIPIFSLCFKSIASRDYLGVVASCGRL